MVWADPQAPIAKLLSSMPLVPARSFAEWKMVHCDPS